MTETTNTTTATIGQPALSRDRLFWRDAWRQDQQKCERMAARYAWCDDKGAYYRRTAQHYKSLADQMEGLA